FPANLAFIYPQWNPASAALWAGPIALIIVLALVIALRNRIGRGVTAAVLIFVGVLVPALGFFDFYPMRYSYVADHFQYLAAPALIALIVAAIARLLRALGPAVQKGGGYVLAGLVLIACLALSIRQAQIYASPLDLWRDTAAKNPDSWMVRNNFGAA